jgi:hypothetical protein
MNARFEGGPSTALLIVDSLTIRVGEMKLSCTTPFPLHFEIDYSPAVKGTNWEEPDEPEFLNLISATLLSPIFMSNFSGITLSLDARLNVLELLDDRQYGILWEALLQPNTCAAFDGRGVTL